ncbi:MAG: formylmethanofuran--tetrahydromethanopterin formyltransferase [Pirellulaceae bacterium]|nr:MAG: formylmethanofuran--tetrahydromethanopterin formyltransferase [Pirellulaceae bacterium]
MILNGTEIEDTFAEAFGMRFVRLLITAEESYWLDAALREFCGDSASVIGCDAEIGTELWWDPSQTPDGRPGASVLVFGFSVDALQKAVPRRVGQCVMTCPTTAVFDTLEPTDRRIKVGRHVRFFGDGYQQSKLWVDRRYWRVPVMDGEFWVVDEAYVGRGVAGGNIIIQGRTCRVALEAARRAVEAIAALPGVITPFPGGVVRSGSKVGSRYRNLKASTADAFCPTLRGVVQTRLHPEANAAYEIVIDGVDVEHVGRAMGAAIRAACGPGIVRISAGNYGGKLGPYPIPLHQVLQTPSNGKDANNVTKQASA